MGCALTVLDGETLVGSGRARIPLINLKHSMPRRNMAGGKKKKSKNEKKKGEKKHTHMDMDSGRGVREVGSGGNHPR